MAAVPYQAHNALFKHRTSGLPHVSDMRALQYLSASQQVKQHNTQRQYEM